MRVGAPLGQPAGAPVATVIAQPCRCGVGSSRAAKVAPAGRAGGASPSTQEKQQPAADRPCYAPSSGAMVIQVASRPPPWALPLADGGARLASTPEAGGLQPRPFWSRSGPDRSCGSCSRSPAPDRCPAVGAELACRGEGPCRAAAVRCRFLANGGIQGQDLADPGGPEAVMGPGPAGGWRDRLLTMGDDAPWGDRP